MNPSKKIYRFCLAILFIMISKSTPIAQEAKVWTNLGLYGGRIYDIAIDPAKPDKMFASSYMGDGLFVTENAGISWQAVETANEPEGEATFKNQAVWAVKIAPSNNNVIWVAHNQWAEKSADGGKTWTHISNSDMQRDCENCGGHGDNYRFCLSAAIDPTHSHIVYVGTGGPMGTDSRGAIYKTEDGGETWAKMNQGHDMDYSVVDIDIDPQNSNILWAVTNSFGVGGWTGTLYRSEDGGGSWSTVFTIPGSFYAVEVKPNDSNSIFTANAYGIFRHYFHEGEWKYDWILNYWGQWPPPSDEVFARMVTALAFDQQNLGVIYAAWKNPYGGDSRPKVARGRPPYADTDWEIFTVDYNFDALVVHPTNSDVIFGGEFNLGLFKSQDHGQSWTPLNERINAVIVYDVALDPNDPKHFLAGTLSGVYEKKGTEAWSRLIPYSTRTLLFHPTDSQTFYAGLEGWLARTADGGKMWNYTSLSGFILKDLTIDPTNTDILFVASEGWTGTGAIHKSEDGGASFEKVLDGVNQFEEGHAFQNIVIDPSDHQHIFAGGGNFYAPHVLGDLWESEDGGLSWTRTSLQNVVVNDVLVDPVNSDIMYAGCGYSGGTDVPVYKSTDGGATWNASYEGIPSGFKVLKDVWGSSRIDVLTVGFGPYAAILHYDGNDWNEMDTGTTQTLNALWGASAKDVFSVGTLGTIIHYNGRDWSVMNSGTGEALWDVWGSSGNNVFAVGNNGTILHYDGSGWAARTSSITDALFGIWGSSEKEVFVVGNGGTILKYNGTTWETISSSITQTLNAVWGSSGSDVFAVGGGGTILHYDGNSWSEMSSVTTERLNDVWGSSGSDVFAVGDDGIILHYDGSGWSAVNSGTTQALEGIWGSSGNDIFVVGDHGGILHYDGSGWAMIRPEGRSWNSVTDLEFDPKKSIVVYASTAGAGIYVSPNEAGKWLNLGIPDYLVHAISTSSLHAATEGGLQECTGNGVIAGEVTDARNKTGINQANVWSDFGVNTVSVMGEYMMTHPTGTFDVFADAEKYFESRVSGVTVWGGEVTWTNIPMQSVFRVIGILPHDKAGIDDSTRVSIDTSFAVLITSPDGLDITNQNSIKFTVDDGVNEPYIRNLGHRSVRIVKVNPYEEDTNVTKLWAVYDRSKDAPYDNEYAFDSRVDMQVEATDKAGMQTSTRASFKTETQEEHDDELLSLPDTKPVDPTDPALVGLHNAGTQVSSGDLKGAKIVYNSSEPVLPRFGPLNELPTMDIEGSEAVGVPLNLQPHTVFETPVKIFIPCPDWSDVSSLNVYVFKEDNWALACDCDGHVLSGGDGWMVPGSRVNHNNGSPSTIEVQVYRFSGAQAAGNTSTDGNIGGSSSGGGGCFIDTVAYGLVWPKR